VGTDLKVYLLDTGTPIYRSPYDTCLGEGAKYSIK